MEEWKYSFFKNSSNLSIYLSGLNKQTFERLRIGPLEREVQVSSLSEPFY